MEKSKQNVSDDSKTQNALFERVSFFAFVSIREMSAYSIAVFLYVLWIKSKPSHSLLCGRAIL
jgi:hypothetical protein